MWTEKVMWMYLLNVDEMRNRVHLSRVCDFSEQSGCRIKCICVFGENEEVGAVADDKKDAKRRGRVT